MLSKALSKAPFTSKDSKVGQYIRLLLKAPFEGKIHTFSRKYGWNSHFSCYFVAKKREPLTVLYVFTNKEMTRKLKHDMKGFFQHPTILTSPKNQKAPLHFWKNGQNLSYIVKNVLFLGGKRRLSFISDFGIWKAPKTKSIVSQLSVDVFM